MSTKIYWKCSFDFREEFQFGEFLQKRFRNAYILRKPAAPGKGAARGIAPEKKKNILKNLSSLMPINRLLFWNQIQENEHSVDLTNQHLST